MLRCVLLDDELNGLEYLRLLCGQLANVEVVKCYNDPQRFLREEAGLEYDIVLLDIDMPGLNGLQVAQLLPGRSIIFTTAHDRFAADAFDLSAVDFIRKPITRERLERGLEKARERQQQRTAGGGMVQVMTDRGRTLVRWSEVLWVTTPEQEKRDKLLHLADGTVLRLKNSSLDQLLSLFPEGAFARVNRSDIVALARVHLVADDVVHLRTSGAGKDATRIPLGAAYKEAFLALMGAR